MTDRKPCAYCSRPLPDVCRKNDRYCPHCKPVAHMLRDSAIKKVYDAIRAGKLPPVSLSTCDDCGAPATIYDHRSYDKPLDVRPVCARCNVLRGPAIFII